MKEEKLFYDPRSTLLLELVEEYIEHNLLAEAETLLKDYLRTNPLSEKAITLWIKIAREQKDTEKERHLREKLRKIKEKKGEEVKFEEEIKEEIKEEVKIEEEEREEVKVFEFLRDIKEIEKVKKDEELLSFITILVPYFKKWGIGEPQEVIVECEKPEIGFKSNGKWNFVEFKKDTNFVTLKWALKKLKWNR